MSYQPVLQSFHDWLQNLMAWFSSSTSAMDFHTALICAGVFIISALVVYLISVFGMRERTYEEAIEEQRRRNQEALQQAKTDKNKKEKKFKKWGKRSKEKIEEDRSSAYEVENKTSEELDSKGESETNCSATSQTLPLKNTQGKKVRQRKQEKGEECPQQLSSSEDTDELPSVSNEQSATEDKSSSPLEKNGPNDDVKMQIEESPIEIQEDFKEKADTDLAKPTRRSPVKKTKKNKSETADLLSENADSKENKIINAIKSISLTEDEVQHIIEALNSKQKNTSAEKKKSDYAALKKLIQEKEEALKVEQKQCQAANEKICDLQQELCDLKAQATATEKSLREALKQEQQEIKALHGMMQRKHDQYASEINALQSKMQQMKNKMKEDHALALQRSQEENNQLQSLSRLESEKQQRNALEISRLQHEVEQLRSSREKYETHQAAMQQNQEELHHQIQQLEKHIEQLMTSHQEDEYSYKQRINEMSNKIQQTENSRSSLVQELQNAQSVCSSLEAENSSLRQRLEEAKHKLNSSEQDIMKLQNRLEESNRQQMDLANCIEKLRDEVMELSNIKCEQQQVMQTLKQENESLTAKVTQNLGRMAGDGADQKRQNGESLEMKSHLIDVEEHEQILQEKETFIQHLLQDLDQCKCEIVSTSNELRSEKKVIKGLTEKNIELNESVKRLEEKLQDVIKTAEKKVQEAQRKADSCSKEMQNILNEQIREVEHTLQESYSKELQDVRQEAENIKKEAEDRLLKAETQANLRLEEFQESLYERLNQINTESEARVTEALKEKEKVASELEKFASSLQEFLQRIFPNLKVPETLDKKSLWKKYETEVCSYLENLKSNWNHESKDIENVMQKLEETMNEKINLESQIKNYKNVLAETEKILKDLQNNIENEERIWKKESQCKDETLKEILNENEKLKSQNENLQTNLEQLKGLKEALYEIEELRLKLQKEELEKKLLQEKIGVIDSLATSISVSDTNLMQIPEVNGASGKK